MPLSFPKHMGWAGGLGAGREQQVTARPAVTDRALVRDLARFGSLFLAGYPLPPAFGCPLRRTPFNAKDGPAGGSRPAGGRIGKISLARPAPFRPPAAGPLPPADGVFVKTEVGPYSKHGEAGGSRWPATPCRKAFGVRPEDTFYAKRRPAGGSGPTAGSRT